MPAYPATGIVLRRISLGETDRIITLLTRDQGKVHAVAKGARKPGSRSGGATELFTLTRFMLAPGRSLEIVSQCEVQESFPALRADLGLLARATYLCELADRLTEDHEPSPDVFDSLVSAFYLLRRRADDPDIVLHAFELQLLSERGYAPGLAQCVTCGAEPGGQGLSYSPTLGGLLCGRCRRPMDAIPLPATALDLMRRMADADADGIVALKGAAPDLQVVGRCLKWTIRYRIDRDIKSAEFLDSLRPQGAVPA